MSTQTAANDRELLFQIAGGSERAFDTIYHRYSRRVYIFALRILRSDTLAEEVMQETLLKMWLMGKESIKITNLDNFMCTVARNASLNLLRRQEIERRAQRTLAVTWQEYDYNTEEHISLNEAKRILEEAVLLLPPKQQEAFRLCHQQGLKYEEAAVLMDISPQTVAVHVKLALRFVRNYVKKATDLLALLVILRLF